MRVAIALVTLCGVLSCTSDNPQVGGPCLANNPPAGCGAKCATDEQCDDGLYCGTVGCTADCDANRSCPVGSCNQRGRCISTEDDGSIPGADSNHCPDVNVSLEPVTPDVMLLIDQSGSMTDSFGRIGGRSVDRWEAVRYALTDQNNGAVTKLQQKVRFGATLYHSVDGTTKGGICPILIRSPGTPPGQPKLDNRSAIDKLFADNNPVQDTPTAEAVDAVVADMKAWMANPDDNGLKVLLLATDGNPDNCDDPDAHDENSQKMSEKAVQAAFAAGIRTYVLSVGSDVSVEHLEKLANAGAGKPLTPPDAPFFRGNSPDELVGAFDAIMGGVRTCTFALDGAVESQYEKSGTVTLNGETLQQGVDWKLTNPSAIELLGEACQTFMSAKTVSLQATFPCGAVIR